MKRLAALAIVVAVLVSCDEDPQAISNAPTAPAPAVVSPAEALLLAPVKKTESSVCRSYTKKRTKLVAELEQAPNDTALVRQASALAVLITDACN